AGIYAAGLASGLPGILVRGALCAVCLLPPTLLMGATLPALARWVESSPRGISWLGLLYAANTAGAVAGCLLAGLDRLRGHGLALGRRHQRGGGVRRPGAGGARREAGAGAGGGARSALRRRPFPRRAGGHRALRPHRPRRGGGVDAAPLAPPRRDRVHVLH